MRSHTPANNTPYALAATVRAYARLFFYTFFGALGLPTLEYKD